jgi:UDPglucose 6-dehydrogenase
MDVTMAASSANAAQQARFADRIARLLVGLEGRTIGLLGLAFKAGTDDVRESPAVALASQLISWGATVRAYDPQAGANALRSEPRMAVFGSAAEALVGADMAVIATEWPEFRELDWEALRDRLTQPLIVDGRRMLDSAAMEALGYRYEAVGRGPTEDRLTPASATSTTNSASRA